MKIRYNKTVKILIYWMRIKNKQLGLVKNIQNKNKLFCKYKRKRIW